MSRPEAQGKPIYCIGDSHVSYFSGNLKMQPIWPYPTQDLIPTWRIFRLGPVLAYNLNKPKSSTMGRERLFAALAEIPKHSRVLLCYGEIDCRVHLIRQAQKQNQSYEQIVAMCLQPYFSVIEELRHDYELILWNPIPSSWKEKIDDELYPIFGTSVERNEMTRIFNSELNDFAKNNNLKTLSLFEQLLTADGQTNRAFYSDDIHLSQKSMPMCINKLESLYPDENFRLFNSWLLNSLPKAWQKIIFARICNIKSSEFRKTFVYRQLFRLRQLELRWINKRKASKLEKRLTAERNRSGRKILVVNRTQNSPVIDRVLRLFDQIYLHTQSGTDYDRYSAKYFGVQNVEVLEPGQSLVVNDAEQIVLEDML